MLAHAKQQDGGVVRTTDSLPDTSLFVFAQTTWLTLGEPLMKDEKQSRVWQCVPCSQRYHRHLVALNPTLEAPCTEYACTILSLHLYHFKDLFTELWLATESTSPEGQPKSSGTKKIVTRKTVRVLGQRARASLQQKCQA